MLSYLPLASHKFVATPINSHFLQHPKNTLRINTTSKQKYPPNAPIVFSYTSWSKPPEYDHPMFEPLHNDEQFSMVGLRRDSMPKHVAIALDGNRRWLKFHKRGLDYMPFFQKKLLFAKLCLKWDIGTATSFVWGLGNFTERVQDNEFFFGQFEQFLKGYWENFKRDGIKVLVKGETPLLPESLQATIAEVEEATKNCTKLEFYLAVCYTGQWGITEATRRICEKVKEGVIEPQDVNEDMIEKQLSLSFSPPPDFFIRTGGELRIGALLMWQIAHTELYFTNILAPEFGEDVFLDALRSFQQRDRKFGK